MDKIWTWERVDGSTRRMRVEGGWIVETFYEDLARGAYAVALCYVPEVVKEEIHNELEIKVKGGA